MARHILGWITVLGLLPGLGVAEQICTGFGPQTPRDIADKYGENAQLYAFAPQPWAMNLCNIHTHTYAEHKGPGFSLPAPSDHTALEPPRIERIYRTASGHGDDSHVAAPSGHDEAPKGWRCNETAMVSSADRADPFAGHGPFGNVRPGDTIEVHWVYSTCDVDPGPGLGSCVSDGCTNPQLRVESQVFLLVTDPQAPSFSAFDYAGHMVNGRHQPKALPTGTGAPVVFRGSTTGPSYTQQTCSPYQVTWSVRPACMPLNIMSLHAWAAAGNIFEEDHSHGVRELVTAPELLSPID